MDKILIDFLLGSAGALIRAITEDNGLVLPNLKDGKLYLGGIGGILIGGAAGCLANHDGITTFLAGYAGTAFITFLVTSRGEQRTPEQKTTEQIIREVANNAGVSADLAVAVAKCESSLNPQAVNINKDGSVDRGLFQINGKYHPEISEADAFDPTKATQFFCDAFKAGHINWWNASKNCWSK